MGKPLVFVSLNYRLGALGFMHSPEASDLIPPNNGLHDQLTGFDWIHRNIEGFGGDRNNITAIGQSAGGESLSLHNLSGCKEFLYKKSIMFSGTPLTMPDKTPSEHQENFLNLAKRTGLDTNDRSSADIAQEMITCDVSNIRDLGYVGQPCVDSEIIPHSDHANMRAISNGSVSFVPWLESQVISAASYDGSISNIMMRGDKSRKDHAKSFSAIAQDVLQHPQELLQIYNIKVGMPDEDALEAICQFESDIGFFAAALAVAKGTAGKAATYFQLFELGNPFEGPLEQREFASHTWDIVALLGAYEERLPADYVGSIRAWRERYIKYIVDGNAPWPKFDEAKGRMLALPNDGPPSETSLVKVLHGRRQRLLDLAEQEGPDGADALWESVCRRWLMAGK